MGAAWLQRLFGRGDREHPLLSTKAGLKTLLDDSPAVLLLIDEDVAENVYRNDAAVDMMKRTIEANGQEALLSLRRELRNICLNSTSFPATAQVEAEVDGERSYATLIVNKVPGGFAYTWKNVTSEVRLALLHDELAEELADASTWLSGLGDDLASVTREAAGQADAISRASQEMAQATREIARRVQAATTSTETAVASATAASASVHNLQESSDRIGSITSLIEAVAAKTKLLALNASIEAARAGELGRGFAVVATEVRDLAAQTAEATQRIAGMIEEIQGESGVAASAIADIVEHINVVSEQQTMISGAVDEQSAVTAEMSGSIGAVATSVRVSADSAEKVQATAVAINAQAERLREVVKSQSWTTS